MSLFEIFPVLNKFIPGRMAALVDRLNGLKAEYAKAVIEGRDTDAALLKKQANELRKKAGLAGSDI